MLCCNPKTTIFFLKAKEKKQCQRILEFVPLLLFQLCYKTIWFAGILLPFLLTNEPQTYVIVFIVIFASYIIGDLIAIPFHYLFRKESE